ncbi:MAG TPA: peptidylprolyl isomerase [Bryobacteraceae bacterium]|jgi:tetratricopeptide (TPR) repeat protein|nr:peptidylprolyl isomerase [Bryobacteraceae bacterium]
MKRIIWLFLFLSTWCTAADLGPAHYVGQETCALCHKQIAAGQQHTAMAGTWQGRMTSRLPASFDAKATEPPAYEIRRSENGFQSSIALPDGSQTTLPVETIMGGSRHGLGFLIRIKEIDGIPLARPALVQARYAWSLTQKKLLLAPGCSAAKPDNYESAVGLTLSPTFESKCLACHGEPNAKGPAGKTGGVHCETCHGPGSSHLLAAGQGSPQAGIVNPARLSPEQSIAICAQCHVGLARFSDPTPDDLLVANQVRALESSECFLQSGKSFSCTACHDPHKDTSGEDKRAVNTCLGCHSTRARPHAAICPVNSTGECIGCHMPSVEMGPLHLVDHVIRVHPEQQVSAHASGAGLASQVRPISEYLRIIVTNSEAAAAKARERVSQGESFYNVARAMSVDYTAPIGGYLGRKNIAELGNPALADAAAALRYGQASSVVQENGRWVILQRTPRDFRWQAEQLQREAEDRMRQGDAAGAIEKSREALTLYPHFLRALASISAVYLQGGNPKKSSEILTVAERLYPQDAGIEFALAESLAALGDRAGAERAYARTIELDPDFVAAYVNLGTNLFSDRQYQEAGRRFQQGLQIDPLSGELYYGLTLSLSRAGDTSGADRAMALARRLAPNVVPK